MTEDFAPISDADWPQDIADMLPGFAGGLNVYRAMAHHPALLRSWEALREHVVNQTSLGAQRSEVVILRTGARLGSDYEWQQHVVRARKVGLSDVRILDLKKPLDQIGGEDRLLAEAVDCLFEKRGLSRDLQAQLQPVIGKQGILDLMATVGFYSTLGFVLNSFETPLDLDIQNVLTETPLPS